MSRVGPLVGVLAATALSVTANGIGAIAVPWLVLERTGSALAGLAGAAAIAPIVFAAVFGGAPIDRIGKRRTSMIADVLSASAVAALPLADATVGLGVGLVPVLVAIGAVVDTYGPAAGFAAIGMGLGLAAVIAGTSRSLRGLGRPPRHA